MAKPVGVASDDRGSALSVVSDGRLETATHASVFTDHFPGWPPADPDHCVSDFDLRQ